MDALVPAPVTAPATMTFPAARRVAATVAYSSRTPVRRTTVAQ